MVTSYGEVDSMLASHERRLGSFNISQKLRWEKTYFGNCQSCQEFEKFGLWWILYCHMGWMWIGLIFFMDIRWIVIHYFFSIITHAQVVQSSKIKCRALAQLQEFRYMFGNHGHDFFWYFAHFVC